MSWSSIVRRPSTGLRPEPRNIFCETKKNRTLQKKLWVHWTHRVLRAGLRPTFRYLSSESVLSTRNCSYTNKLVFERHPDVRKSPVVQWLPPLIPILIAFARYLSQTIVNYHQSDSSGPSKCCGSIGGSGYVWAGWNGSFTKGCSQSGRGSKWSGFRYNLEIRFSKTEIWLPK